MVLGDPQLGDEECCLCRPRLLFQHQAYSNQEPLDMGEREVAAVVEAVCGAAEAPAIWGVRPRTCYL